MPCRSKSNISYVCFYSIYLYGNIFLAISGKFGDYGKPEINSQVQKTCVCVYFSFPLTPKFLINGLKNVKCKDKYDKSTRRICLIYNSILPFIYNIKFPLTNLNINNLMHINFHISLITKRFFRSFDRHSDKTVTLSELLPNINKFRNEMLDFFRSFTKVASKLF